MDNNDENDDLTFCQVTAPVNVDLFEAQKIIPGVTNISLNDETSKSSGVLSKRDLRTSKELSDSADAASEDMKSYVSVLQEPKSVVRKPIARAKVPFEKGYSPMDWLKLTRTHPDLGGLKGQSNKRLISLQEVKLHKTEDSMWTVLKGRVYNITPYMKFHPGGVDFLMKAVGKDCTALFNKYHAWVNAEFLLEKCLVGILDDSQ